MAIARWYLSFTVSGMHVWWHMSVFARCRAIVLHLPTKIIALSWLFSVHTLRKHYRPPFTARRMRLVCDLAVSLFVSVLSFHERSNNINSNTTSASCMHVQCVVWAALALFIRLRCHNFPLAHTTAPPASLIVLLSWSWRAHESYAYCAFPFNYAHLFISITIW